MGLSDLVPVERLASKRTLSAKHILSEKRAEIFQPVAQIFATLLTNTHNFSGAILDPTSDLRLHDFEIEMKSIRNFKSHQMPDDVMKVLDELLQESFPRTVQVPNPFFKNWIVPPDGNVVAIDFDQAFPSSLPGFFIGQFLADIYLMHHRSVEVSRDLATGYGEEFLNEFRHSLAQASYPENIDSLLSNVRRWAAVFILYRGEHSDAPDRTIKDQVALIADFRERFI